MITLMNRLCELEPPLGDGGQLLDDPRRLAHADGGPQAQIDRWLRTP